MHQLIFKYLTPFGGKKDNEILFCTLQPHFTKYHSCIDHDAFINKNY